MYVGTTVQLDGVERKGPLVAHFSSRWPDFRTTHNSVTASGGIIERG